MAKSNTELAAKAVQSESPDNEVRQLAERMFIRQWQPQQSVTPEALASMCLSGAAAFCKVASTNQSER